ncbi:MAG: DUF2892 domain-containing protein [Tepidisphaeraceae bacterium]
MSTRSAVKDMKQAVREVDIDAVTEQARSGWDRLKRQLPENISGDEKRLSLVGGAALGAIGLARIGHLSGWLALGAAAALLVRGTTGHCALYSKMGIDTKHGS